MMTKATVQNKKDISSAVSKIGYGAFVALSVYFLATGQTTTAASNLGIALIFDPFNQEQPWNKRPLYQRVWLIVHVLAVIGLFCWQWMTK